MFKIIRESGEIVVQPEWPQYHPAWSAHVDAMLKRNQEWLQKHMKKVGDVANDLFLAK